MNNDVNSSMLEYYGQRAPEFDDVYLGGGPASISDPEAYRHEVDVLSNIIRLTCSGKLIDVACGTAFWLPHYAAQCSSITLFDQSGEMLRHAQARATTTGVTDDTTIISGDALDHDFGQDQFDTAIVAFLISHFTAEQEGRFFRAMRRALKPGGRIVILDSVWNDARAQTREKEGPQKRTLADGREFTIYKKYFNKSDISEMQSIHKIGFTLEHFGKVFFAAIGRIQQG